MGELLVVAVGLVIVLSPVNSYTIGFVAGTVDFFLGVVMVGANGKLGNEISGSRSDT